MAYLHPLPCPTVGAGAACDDGDAETMDDVCIAGDVCQGTVSLAAQLTLPIGDTTNLVLPRNGGFRDNGWFDVLSLQVPPQPTGWTLDSATVCVSLSYSAAVTGTTGKCKTGPANNADYGGKLGALRLRLKMQGSGKKKDLMLKEGFANDVLTQTCFTDSAANDFPTDLTAANAAAPFTGTFKPKKRFFNYLDDHGVGDDGHDR